MGLFDKLRHGTQVFGTDNRSIGTVDRWDDNNVYVGGKPYARSMFDRLDNDRLYFSDSGYRTYQASAQGSLMDRGASTAGSSRRSEADSGQVRIPVAEERIGVEKRQGELGAVEVHKTVEHEQVNVPVEVHHEEVHVNRVDVPERPIAAGDVPDAFKEGTIRVPVRGEEAVAHKETVVTGEVVVDREVKTDRQTISDTVRRERVDVDEDYRRNREGFRQHFEGRRSGLTGTAVDTRTFDDAETNYRTGFTAGRDQRWAGRDFDEAEPEIRRQHRATGSDDSEWERLREEVREGFNRARR